VLSRHPAAALSDHHWSQKSPWATRQVAGNVH
jgi:hypothetical protein